MLITSDWLISPKIWQPGITLWVSVRKGSQLFVKVVEWPYTTVVCDLFHLSHETAPAEAPAECGITTVHLQVFMLGSSAGAEKNQTQILPSKIVNICNLKATQLCQWQNMVPTITYNFGKYVNFTETINIRY